MTPPDPWDAGLSAIRTAADSLGPWLAIWQARHEPDAHARRCASDALGAIDAALAGLYGIRARLVGETRRADDETAARADELLAQTRDGPGAVSSGTVNRPTSPPAQGAEVCIQVSAQCRHGGEPREATP
jgi:hypothetical protein